MNFMVKEESFYWGGVFSLSCSSVIQRQVFFRANTRNQNVNFYVPDREITTVLEVKGTLY